ncbi:uncharacterized protein KGF55_003280 [Candida pseudojiufengensis]|uniref:uncharacterized protein n=1 Tax=Candida pseudojiufengensis TaxID=497109 RepID=UPI0022257EC7|nr:uncharacterized protein KGF55_003280 [Candida pseudojiufengensis]KAI5962204.1 hypothetical protein KGF55_003280 [Candida pseudojiufengensis]
MNFLILSSDVNEPFIIPNVSPVSSPKLIASKEIDNTSSIITKPIISNTTSLTPLVHIEDDDENEENNNLISMRKLSDFELN